MYNIDADIILKYYINQIVQPARFMSLLSNGYALNVLLYFDLYYQLIQTHVHMTCIPPPTPQLKTLAILF